jgi:hypothetical protein
VRERVKKNEREGELKKEDGKGRGRVR